MDKPSPIVSELDSTEDAPTYAAWFRAKVAASLANPEPSAPHDTVMAEVGGIIARAERQQPPG